MAFGSFASTLISGDNNGSDDIFVRDQETGTTTRVGVATGGVEGNSASLNAWISGDGRYVSFESFASNLVVGDTNEAYDIFVHDRMTATTTRVSVGPGGK